MAVTLTSTGIQFSDGSSLTTGSMIKSIQTIFINSSGGTTSGGDYSTYKDFTIATVTDTAKCVVHYHPGAPAEGSTAGAALGLQSYTSGATTNPTALSITFPNTTSLRINSSVGVGVWNVKGRLTIVEYA